MMEGELGGHSADERCGIQSELFGTEEEELYTGSCIVQVCALDAVLTMTHRSVQRF